MTMQSTTAAVNPAVALEIARMLEAEGPYRCEGIFIADVDRAARQRRLVAERTVAAAERRAAWLARNPVCSWCTMRLAPDAPVTLIAGDAICAACVPDYERTVFGESAGSLPAAPLDDSDVAVIEAETGIALAFDHGQTCGESVGEQAGARQATFHELGRAA